MPKLITLLSKSELGWLLNPEEQKRQDRIYKLEVKGRLTKKETAEVKALKKEQTPLEKRYAKIGLSPREIA